MQLNGAEKLFGRGQELNLQVKLFQRHNYEKIKKDLRSQQNNYSKVDGQSSRQIEKITALFYKALEITGEGGVSGNPRTGSESRGRSLQLPLQLPQLRCWLRLLRDQRQPCCGLQTRQDKIIERSRQKKFKFFEVKATKITEQVYIIITWHARIDHFIDRQHLFVS